MNTLIHSTDEVRRFMAIFPPLKKDEVFYLALFMRNKHLTEDERKETGLPRSNVIGRQVCRTPEDVVRKLRRWEGHEEGFISKAKGLPIPNKCLVPYITIQPISVLKCYLEFNRIFSDYIVELSKEGNRDDTYARIKKADMLLMDCFQHAYAYKLFVDIDFDIPNKEWDGITIYEEHLESKGVKYHRIETNGGFHYLLETATVKYNYHEFLEGMREKAHADFALEKYEIEVSSNMAVPIPGTFQYGQFPVIFK